MDTTNVALSKNNEMGNLNSSRPVFKKYVWIEKANIPPPLNIKEKISPPNDRLNVKTRPYKIINKIGKWSMINEVIPPGSLNNSHSFQ
jgi:hypothetical protein